MRVLKTSHSMIRMVPSIKHRDTCLYYVYRHSRGGGGGGGSLPLEVVPDARESPSKSTRNADLMVYQ